MAALRINMRIIARYAKQGTAKYISHLDLQRVIQRALRRAGVPVKYSEGFNPHPLLSFASALSVGYTGSCEYMDIRLCEDMGVPIFIERMNQTLPSGLSIKGAAKAELTFPALTKILCGAKYDIKLKPDEAFTENAVVQAIDELMAGEIIVNKRTKSGMRMTDIRPMLIAMSLQKEQTLCVEAVLNASGGLNVELLMQALFEKLGVKIPFSVHRSLLGFEQDFCNKF